MRKIFTILLILFILLSGCSKNEPKNNPTSTTSYNSEISGTIYKQDCCNSHNPYYPFQGAGVELYENSKIDLLGNTLTDANGMYAFKI